MNFINRTRMLDLSAACSGFTWSNHRYGEDFIRERLDRFLATEQWRNLYAQAKIMHLEEAGSDHSPILLY